MNDFIGIARGISIVALLGILTAPLSAENADPDSDGSQYAWGENVGWLNAEPGGDGGSGIQVDDFELRGWMWGENIGWVSLSCLDSSSCETTEYRVVNDGGGVLSGFAWAENVGWIDFAPTTAGVFIDPTTGDFSGRAWGENIGWVTFASTGANPYKVKTGWGCDPAPPVPTGSPILSAEKSAGSLLLSWGGISGETGFDVVHGDLDLLRSSAGDFAAATLGCLANNLTATSTVCGGACSGNALWFLVRGVNCAEAGGAYGTYDSGAPSQSGARDAEIASSGNDCP